MKGCRASSVFFICFSLRLTCASCVFFDFTSTNHFRIVFIDLTRIFIARIEVRVYQNVWQSIDNLDSPKTFRFSQCQSLRLFLTCLIRRSVLLMSTMGKRFLFFFSIIDNRIGKSLLMNNCSTCLYRRKVPIKIWSNAIILSLSLSFFHFSSRWDFCEYW